MLILNLIILILFLGGLILSAEYSQDVIRNIDKKEHKLYVLYPFADWILRKSGFDKALLRKTSVTDSIKALYITEKPDQLQRLYWCRKISVVMSVVILFDILSILGQLFADDGSVIIDGKYLRRPDYGQGGSEVELNVTVEEEKDTNQEVLQQDVSIHVKGRTYTEEELEQIFDQAFTYLKTNVLGKNKSSDQIYENLNFSDRIPGTDVAVRWQPEDEKLIQSDGTVNNENISTEGERTSVAVILSYQEKQAEYSMSFTIMPKQYDDKELLQRDLEEQISTYAENTAEDEYLELPDTLGDYRLSWEDKVNNSNAALFVFGIMLAAVCWIGADKELEKQMKKRREQMLFDYPEIINKFTLLMNAGMTVKQAWYKIAEDYCQLSSKKQFKKRFAYEEMLTTINELKLGLAENIAYEKYGRRIGLIPYIKFSSLIAQNLRKGNKGFTELLLKEAIAAFEERKEVAKRLGEEAGTKLLIPMMVMLIIVFLMIMLPAFWAFKI